MLSLSSIFKSADDVYGGNLTYEPPPFSSSDL